MAESLFQPVFMFGMERSGTTLLSMIIGAHPDVDVPLATTGMWFSFYEQVQQRYNNLTNAADLDHLLDDVLSHDRVKIWNTRLDREEIRSKLMPGCFGSVISAVHQQRAEVENKKYWMNMDIATLDNMHIVNEWFPAARFVHILRDGRDVALSHQTMPYGAGNIGECATAWLNRIGQNLRMGHMLGKERYIAFRYEDLVDKTEETLKCICQFCGINYSQEMLSYSDTVDRRVPKDKMWLWPALKDAPRRDKMYRWKSSMTENQRIVFEGIAGELLDELGYETYDGLPKKTMAYLLELYYCLDRGGRVKRLKRKLGINTTSELERRAGIREQ
jgi:hypothetical protein